ncbi:MAG: DsbA family protein [Nanoarchaeota archaeon]|nr:DsbA family protein [Nanoarchaeota archaeon]
MVIKKEIIVVVILLINLPIISFVSAQNDVFCFKELNMNLNFDNGIISMQNPLENNPAINILSPKSIDYNENRIRLNIIVNKKCDLEYADYKIDDISFLPCSLNPITIPDYKFKPLCKRCYEYNISKSFTDGTHYLVSRCKDKKDIKSSVLFNVDRQDPKITYIKPENHRFVNGKNFLIRYQPDYLSYAEVYIRDVCRNPKICTELIYRGNCALGKTDECIFNLNLSPFEGKEIEYYYVLTNIGSNSAKSNKFRVFVDTVPPEIKSFNYITESNRVVFNVNVDEVNLDRTEYIDYHERNPVWKTLCNANSCSQGANYKSGTHYYDIRAIDKAGNIGYMFRLTPDDDSILGNKNAPITIIAFIDYQNNISYRFYKDILPRLKEDFIEKGKVKLVFRDNPSTDISILSSQATECVKIQGKDSAFFKMQEKLFDNMENLSYEKIIDLAKNLDTNIVKETDNSSVIVAEYYDIDDCMFFRDSKKEIEKDIDDAKEADVSDTPVFFINKNRLEGSFEYRILKRMIENELKLIK